MATTGPLETSALEKRRFAALCYRLQENQFSLVTLLTQARTVRRRWNLPDWTVGIRPLPVYSFVRTHGVLRMVRRPGMQGGADSGRDALIRFSTKSVHEAIVLRVEGEVDLSTADSLAEAIESAYRENACVIVDLSRLAYLDGSGIRVLMRFAEEAGGRFVVIGSTPTVDRLFVILKLLDILPVVSSLGAAREYLGPK